MCDLFITKFRKILMSDEIFEKIQTIVSGQLGIDKATVKSTSDFTKELGADSLDVVELVMSFEEEFEIEIDDEVAGEMSTVQDAVDYIGKAKA